MARAAALEARRPPPTASAFACGSASATPPQGGSDTRAPYASLQITPPLRGSRREGGARCRAGGGQTRRPIEPEGGKRGVPSSRRGANAAPHNSHGRTGYTRLPLGVRRPVILGSRKPAPDHRRSQLPAQQPLVLFILCILCIDVHKKISIPRRRPGSPRRIRLRLPARLLRLPLQRGSDCPRERGRPARMLSLWWPLSFRAALQAATTSAVTAAARPKESHGAVSGSIRVAELAEAVPGLVRAGRPRSRGPSLCGRDARAPGGIHFVRCVPLKQLHIASWPFVVRLYFLPPLSTFFRLK